MTVTTTDLEFDVLGPLVVRRNGVALTITTRRQRALLLLLLLSPGRVVPTERLIDQLWDGAPPPQAAVTLRSYVSNLRQALGGREGGGAVLVTRGQGYALEIASEAVDATRFRGLVEHGRDLLSRGRAAEALLAHESAEALWLGDPYSEIADHDVVQGVRAQLEEVHLGAVEGRFEALIASGRHADAVPGLESFVTDHPLREGPRALLMLSLYRSGRVAEALELYRRFRELLQEELGIDPGSRLDELHQQILRQAPELDPPSVQGAESRSVPSPSATTPREAPEANRPVVGRERELATLTRHLDALTTSHSGGLVLIGGEAGIGKTTMLDAVDVLARQRGLPTHVGRSPAATGAPAFWPWTQVLESMAAGLDEAELARACQGAARLVAQLSPTIADRIGQPPPATGDNAQALRFLLYQAVSDFVRRVADRPVVVLLDDLHWADLPSLELLSYLTPTLAEAPALIVSAYRDVASERSEALDATLATVSREEAVEEIGLSGLDEEGVSALAHRVIAATEITTVDEALVALLHERTGGNPFFVRQLARLLLESPPDSDPATAPIPPGVRHVIASRLRTVDPRRLALLEAASLVGREFDLRVVARAAGMPLEEALDAYDEAAEHGLVEPGSAETGHRFVHALIQEVVADGLPRGRATKLHAAIARELEDAGAPVDQVAEHMWFGRDLLGARGLPHLLSAADSAAAVFAHERAEEFLRRALVLAQSSVPPEPTTELHVLLALFRLIASARGWGAAEAHEIVARSRGLVEAGGWDEDAVQLWWSLFFFLIDRDDEPAYTEVAEALLTSLQRVDEQGRAGEGPSSESRHATRAAVHLMNIFPALASGDRQAAFTHLQTARRHVEAAANTELAAFDEHLHVMLLLIEGYWSALTDDVEAHRMSIQAAIALADADGRPFPRAVARTLGAATAPYVGDAEFVLDIARQAMDLDHRFGFEWLAAIAESVHAWADACVNGPSPDAAASIQTRLSEVVSAGRHGTESTLLIMLADVQALVGRAEQARDSLTRAGERPGPYGGLLRDVVERRARALSSR